MTIVNKFITFPINRCGRFGRLSSNNHKILLDLDVGDASVFILLITVKSSVCVNSRTSRASRTWGLLLLAVACGSKVELSRLRESDSVSASSWNCINQRFDLEQQ